MPNVDAARIGAVGHSYGGQWAMFAAALRDGFACGAVSDPGIVFDESRGNVNEWEPWYPGLYPQSQRQRARGMPNDENPRTGPYKKLVEDHQDLTDLHALLAPRPFFVSGGVEDPPERWKALKHLVAVNALLGETDRVAMTNRPAHEPDAEANEAVYAWFAWALQQRGGFGVVCRDEGGRHRFQASAAAREVAACLGQAAQITAAAANGCRVGRRGRRTEERRRRTPSRRRVPACRIGARRSPVPRGSVAPRWQRQAGQPW